MLVTLIKTHMNPEARISYGSDIYMATLNDGKQILAEIRHDENPRFLHETELYYDEMCGSQLRTNEEISKEDAKELFEHACNFMHELLVEAGWQ